MVTKNKTKIVEAIEKKKANLNKVLTTNYPTNPKLDYIHEIRVDNATRFLDEINEVLEGIKVLKKNTSCELLSLNEFDKKFAYASKTKDNDYLWFKGFFVKWQKLKVIHLQKQKEFQRFLSTLLH